MRGALASVLVLACSAGCGFRPSGATGGGSGDDAPTDAAHAGDGSSAQSTGDAPPALVCPATAGWFQIPHSASWYFAIASTGHWRASETACESFQLASGSAIHLAVLDDATELAELAAHDPQHDYWVGMFQQANQSDVDVGWLWITGGPGLSGHWSSGEPNDASFLTTGIEDDDEDFGELYGDSASLNDEAGDNDDPALCECDGIAVPADTRAKIP